MATQKSLINDSLGILSENPLLKPMDDSVHMLRRGDNIVRVSESEFDSFESSVVSMACKVPTKEYEPNEGVLVCAISKNHMAYIAKTGMNVSVKDISSEGGRGKLLSNNGDAPVREIVLSPYEPKIAVASEETIFVQDLEQEQHTKLTKEGISFYSVTWSKESSVAAIGSDNQICLWVSPFDFAFNETIACEGEEHISSFCYFNRNLAYGTSDGRVRLYDLDKADICITHALPGLSGQVITAIRMYEDFIIVATQNNTNVHVFTNDEKCMKLQSILFEVENSVANQIEVVDIPNCPDSLMVVIASRNQPLLFFAHFDKKTALFQTVETMNTKGDIVSFACYADRCALNLCCFQKIQTDDSKGVVNTLTYEYHFDQLYSDVMETESVHVDVVDDCEVYDSPAQDSILDEFEFGNFGLTSNPTVVTQPLRCNPEFEFERGNEVDSEVDSEVDIDWDAYLDENPSLFGKSKGIEHVVEEENEVEQEEENLSTGQTDVLETDELDLLFLKEASRFRVPTLQKSSIMDEPTERIAEENKAVAETEKDLLAEPVQVGEMEIKSPVDSNEGNTPNQSGKKRAKRAKSKKSKTESKDEDGVLLSDGERDESPAPPTKGKKKSAKQVETPISKKTKKNEKQTVSNKGSNGQSPARGASSKKKKSKQVGAPEVQETAPESDLLFQITSVLDRESKKLENRFIKERNQREDKFNELAAQLEKSCIRQIQHSLDEIFDKKAKELVTSRIRSGIRTDIQSSLREPFANELKALFERTLAPKITESCQRLFDDVDRSFQTTIAKHAEYAYATDNVQQLSGAVASLTNTCNAIVGTIAQLTSIERGMTAGNFVAPPVALSPTEVITRAISEGDYNTAVDAAVRAADQNILDFVLENISDPLLWLNGSSIDQCVLLAIIQQMSVTLSTNLPLKVEWIRECVSSLDSVRPGENDKINILASLVNNLNATATNTNDQRLSRQIQFIIPFIQTLISH